MSNMQNGVAVVALVGPDGCGKSTVLQDVARADPRSMPRQVQVAGRYATVMDLATPRGMVQLVDFADAQTQGTLMNASPPGSVILVVSAVDSLLPGHRDSLEQAGHRHIPLRAVVLTKVDMIEDEEMLDLVEMEIRELANKHRHQGDTMPIVRTRGPNARPHEGREPGPGKLIGPRALLSILMQ